MNPKYNPRPITSFVEDDFELSKANRVSHKEAIAKAVRKDYVIIAIRIAMPLAAIFISLWLYTMVDNFISYRQIQRFHRNISSS